MEPQRGEYIETHRDCEAAARGEPPGREVACLQICWTKTIKVICHLASYTKRNKFIWKTLGFFTSTMKQQLFVSIYMDYEPQVRTLQTMCLNIVSITHAETQFCFFLLSTFCFKSTIQGQIDESNR